MCGRYARQSDKQKIAEHFHVHGPSLPDFGPSWNVAPQTIQPIVRLNRDTGDLPLSCIAIQSENELKRLGRDVVRGAEVRKGRAVHVEVIRNALFV